MKALGLVEVLLLAVFATAATAAGELRVYSVAEGKYVMTEKVVKSEAEWRQVLTPEQFHILREKGTERAFSGSLHAN